MQGLSDEVVSRIAATCLVIITDMVRNRSLDYLLIYKILT
jgi:hypothetical protein